MTKKELRELIQNLIQEGGYSNYSPNGKTSGLTDTTLNSILKTIATQNEDGDELNESEKEYDVKYWFNTRDGYDYDIITIKASSEEEALQKAKNSPETQRGKDFKIQK